MFNLTSVQSALQAAKLDGWLLDVGTPPRLDYMLTKSCPRR